MRASDTSSGSGSGSKTHWLEVVLSSRAGTIRVHCGDPAPELKVSAPHLLVVDWRGTWWMRVFDGVASPATAARLDAFERRLLDAADASGRGWLALTVSQAAGRTWYLYAHDLADFADVIERQCNAGDGRSLRLEVRSDPDWSVWQQMLEEATAGSRAWHREAPAPLQAAAAPSNSAVAG